jgi:hypothetical protein
LPALPLGQQAACIDESKTTAVARGTLIAAVDKDDEGKPRPYFRLTLDAPVCLEDYPKTREIYDVKSVRLQIIGPTARQQMAALSAGQKVVAVGSFGVYDKPVDTQVAAFDAHEIKLAP